jgi:vacuolar protein sorting-associated protein 45
MNVIEAARNCITQIITSVRGPKILLLDEETLEFVSVVYTQSQIIQKEVYLTVLLSDGKRDEIQQIKAICFLRPTAANINLLKKELANPKYGEYHLFFSNLLRKHGHLEELAKSDVHESVKTVQECFNDYVPIYPDLFTFNVANYTGDGKNSWNVEKLERVCSSLAGVLICLNKWPIIRYDARSILAHRLAEDLGKELLVSQYFS